MEYINRIELQGEVGTVRLCEVAGTHVVNFSLATELVVRKAINTNPLCETTWHNVVAWNGKDVCKLSSIVKGAKVHVVGRIRNTRYTAADGTERVFTEVVASEVSLINE